jgi:hypothetical protein
LASKSSFLTKDIAGEKPSSLKITQSPLSLLLIKSEEFEHFIINGEEVKFKRYDYFVLANIQERVKVITRFQSKSPLH